MEANEVKMILEGALLAAGRPLSVRELGNLFDPMGRPDNDALRQALSELQSDCELRAYELKEVGSGFRFQVREKYGLWISRLWEEKPPRYSRALLETLALIAYKQPITRGEIEEVRGVAVSTNIIRTLLERAWIRVVGHKDVPGKPAMYATTREFLDYFSLKSLKELPSLADIKDIALINPELQLEEEPPHEGRSIELPVEELDDSAEANSEDNGLSMAEADAIVERVEQNVFGDDDAAEEASAESGTTAAAEVPEPGDVDSNAGFDSLPN